MTIIGVVSELWRFPFKSMAGETLPATWVGTDGLVGDRGWAVRDEKAGEIRGAKKIPKLLQCAARYASDPKPGETGSPHLRIQLPDGQTFGTSDGDAAERLSRFLGRQVTLWPRLPAAERDHYRRALPDNADFEQELRQIFGRTADEPLPDLTMFDPELMEYTSPLGTYFDALPLHVLTTATLERLGELNPGASFDRRRFRPNVLISTPSGTPGFAEQEWCGRSLQIGQLTIRCELPTVRCSMTTHEQEGLPKDPSVLRTIVRDANQNVGVYASVTQPGRVAVGDEVRFT